MKENKIKSVMCMILKHLLSKNMCNTIQYNTIQYNTIQQQSIYRTFENSTTRITENSIYAVAPSSALQERGFVDKIETVEVTGSEAYYRCGGGGLGWGWLS
jgi:hypothetical protein